jgi:hypothetical protein
LYLRSRHHAVEQQTRALVLDEPPGKMHKGFVNLVIGHRDCNAIEICSRHDSLLDSLEWMRRPRGIAL